MPITRQETIDALHSALAGDPRVLAVWLEGADAAGHVDEYSDLDVCVSVTGDDALAPAAAAAQAALQALGPLDLAQRGPSGPGFAQTIFHLAGSSPYLLVDFNAYAGGRGSRFAPGDEIERPLVLFDRAGVVRFDRPAPTRAGRAARLAELRQIAAQDARIAKYVLRGEPLEAFGYYHKWLLMPLVELLRMRYTPLHSDYYIVHISRHLPPAVLARLEALFYCASLPDLDQKRIEARAFFDETAAALEEALAG